MRDNGSSSVASKTNDSLTGTPGFRPISLREHCSLLFKHRVLFACVVLSVSIGGAFYSLNKALPYEGNLLIEIADLRSFEPKNLLGAPMTNPDRRTATSESEILRSRAVLSPVVEKLQMDAIIAKKFGAIAAFDYLRFWRHASLSHSDLDNSESSSSDIVISLFEVPDEMLGSPFHIEKISNFQYRVRNAEIGLSSVGSIGQTLVVPTQRGTLRIRPSKITGPKLAEFELQKIPRALAVENLRSNLLVSELGKDSGIVRVTYTDQEPKKVKSVLNELSNTYVSFIRSQKVAAVKGSINLLQAQVPAMRSRVEQAEAAYTSYRVLHKTTDFSEETRSRLARNALHRARLNELIEKRADLSTRLGDQHPLLIGINQQISAAQLQLGNASGELNSGPVVAGELDRRLRAVHVETDILNNVLRKIDELSITLGDESSNVKIIDLAEEPAIPKGSRITLFLSFIIVGIFMGVFAVFINRSLRNINLN
jgi:tyrosine-protein kinase Etk/Wzc